MNCEGSPKQSAIFAAAAIVAARNDVDSVHAVIRLLLFCSSSAFASATVGKTNSSAQISLPLSSQPSRI